MKRTTLLASLLLLGGVVTAQEHPCWRPLPPGDRGDMLPCGDHVVIPEAPAIAPSDSGAMLVEYGRQFIGTPYHFGGKTPKGFDCAGYARYLYLHFGHTLAPYSGGQYRQGVKVASVAEMRPGDLVFFGGRRHGHRVGHTGIVVSADPSTGTFTFIHASTSRGVIISRSSEAYYKKRYIGARRIFRQPADSTAD